LGALFVLIVSSSPCHSSQTFSVTPSILKIDSFFGGAEVSVSAELPKGCEAVIEVTGEKVEEDLMRKGRRWDLWMNVGEIDIDGAPYLYLLKSSAPQLIGAGNRPWGYEALLQGVAFKGRFKTGDKPELFREFVQLKEGQGLYGIFPGAVKISPLNSTRSMAQVSFRLPSRIPEGIYRVCLSVIQDGQTVERRCIPFKVVMKGLPAFLVSLASQHSAIYGVLSIFVAVAGGLLSGVLFKTRKRVKSKEEDQC
jgi:hypothetical protein